MCKPCTGRQITAACAHCGEVKPVASRDAAGQRICERCRRHDRGHRRCGVCGQTASIAVRARGGAPDICTGCYQMPGAVCSVCGKHRECNFARSDHPVCPSCSPRAVAAAPAAARTARRRPAGPRARSATRATPRRCAAAAHALAAASYGGWWPPPGPAATTCATCAGLPAVCVCADCGIEDKLYEKGRCCRCSLSRRAAALLSGGTGQVPGELAAVLTAICSARNQRTALNWLRAGAGAVILADLAAGRIAATHEALDQHPRPRAAGYLRQMLVAGGVLPPRDEELARAEQWLAGLLASITVPEHRRLVRAFATWQVMARLRRTSQARRRPRTYTARARTMISATVRFLSWLSTRGTPLPACRQADIDDWLTAGPGQVTRRGDDIYVQFGRHEVPVPGTLGSLLLTLIADGKPNTGTGSPAVSQWLFPGLLPGQPITPARLAGRLRALGVPVQAGRRAALTGLAARLPAAVLAETLGLQPGTAVRWMHDAGADWNRYAADLARTRNHQPRE